MANWQFGNDIRADEFVQTKNPNLSKTNYGTEKNEAT